MSSLFSQSSWYTLFWKKRSLRFAFYAATAATAALINRTPTWAMLHTLSFSFFHMPPQKGTYTKLIYDENFRLVGGRTEHFLLEKSRLVKVDPGERGYHIFYQVRPTRVQAGATAASIILVTLSSRRGVNSCHTYTVEKWFLFDYVLKVGPAVQEYPNGCRTERMKKENVFGHVLKWTFAGKAQHPVQRGRDSSGKRLRYCSQPTYLYLALENQWLTLSGEGAISTQQA